MINTFGELKKELKPNNEGQELINEIDVKEFVKGLYNFLDQHDIVFNKDLFLNTLTSKEYSNFPKDLLQFLVELISSCSNNGAEDSLEEVLNLLNSDGQTYRPKFKINNDEIFTFEYEVTRSKTILFELLQEFSKTKLNPVATNFVKAAEELNEQTAILSKTIGHQFYDKLMPQVDIYKKAMEEINLLRLFNGRLKDANTAIQSGSAILAIIAVLYIGFGEVEHKMSFRTFNELIKFTNAIKEGEVQGFSIARGDFTLEDIILNPNVFYPVGDVAQFAYIVNEGVEGKLSIIYETRDAVNQMSFLKEEISYNIDKTELKASILPQNYMNLSNQKVSSLIEKKLNSFD